MDETTKKMNPAVKGKWTAALRSGEYTQGQGYLKTADDEYCCLGVLCDLAVKEGIIPEPTESAYRDCYEFGNPGHVRTLDLPAPVLSWAGMNSDYLYRSPMRDGVASTAETVLADLNDNVEGMDFNGIANWIGEHL